MCTRLIAVRGVLTGPRKKGANSLTLTGRIGKSTLTPGSYRLTAKPTANGRAGAPQTVAFKITQADLIAPHPKRPLRAA